MDLAEFQNLADELIRLRCGRHSVGNLYEFLLAAYGDANRAKADFIRFLAGELPARTLEAASEWISEEQGPETEAPSHNGHSVTVGQSLVTADPLHASPFHG
jgi:hypothetical protein